MRLVLRGGDYHTGSDSNGGVQGDLDFTGGSIVTGETMGNGLIIDMTDSDDFILVGTYKNEGPRGICPDDDSDKNAYRQGVRWGITFCDSGGSWPTYTPSDPPVGVYIYYVGFDTWDTEIGSFSSSRTLNGYEGTAYAYAWIDDSSANRTIDTEFDNLQRYSSSGWVNWSSASSSCEDADHDVRIVSNNHVWIEKE